MFKTYLIQYYRIYDLVSFLAHLGLEIAKVVRYEDLVANMVNVKRDLYNFAGLDWSSNVDKWISTLANNFKHGHAYSLLRNASISMNSWRHAPKPLIEAVEDVCADLMDLLGYEKMIIK